MQLGNTVNAKIVKLEKKNFTGPRKYVIVSCPKEITQLWESSVCTTQRKDSKFRFDFVSPRAFVFKIKSKVAHYKHILAALQELVARKQLESMGLTVY